MVDLCQQCTGTHFVPATMLRGLDIITPAELQSFSAYAQARLLTFVMHFPNDLHPEAEKSWKTYVETFLFTLVRFHLCWCSELTGFDGRQVVALTVEGLNRMHNEDAQDPAVELVQILHGIETKVMTRKELWAQLVSGSLLPDPPASRYQEALAWAGDWWNSAQDEDLNPAPKNLVRMWRDAGGVRNITIDPTQGPRSGCEDATRILSEFSDALVESDHALRRHIASTKICMEKMDRLMEEWRDICKLE